MAFSPPASFMGVGGFFYLTLGFRFEVCRGGVFEGSMNTAMTNTQKERIRTMRLKGKKYSEIAYVLGVSANSVSSYCHRNHLSDQDLEKESECLYCGKRIEQSGKGNRKLYCSERCRSAWRRSVKGYSDTIYHHMCPSCGKEFDTTGNRKQKYCSKECFYAQRRRAS